MVVQQLVCVNEGMCQSLERNVLASNRKLQRELEESTHQVGNSRIHSLLQAPCGLTTFPLRIALRLRSPLGNIAEQGRPPVLKCRQGRQNRQGRRRYTRDPTAESFHTCCPRLDLGKRMGNPRR